MKSNKIQCFNVSTESYTGKEQSPKRFGLSAEGFDINFEKEGYDNLIWCVQIKNGRKVWVKKCNISKITHEIPLLTSQNEIKNDDDINDTKTTDSNDSKIETKDAKIDIKDDKIDIKDDKAEKKKTDYNIFIKYYLDKLKSENKDNTAPKILFQATTQEWSRLKKNPDELKLLMDFIKK
jgi:hypothetical protein